MLKTLFLLSVAASVRYAAGIAVDTSPCSTNAECIQKGLPLLKPKPRGWRPNRRDAFSQTFGFMGGSRGFTVANTANYSITLVGGSGGGNPLGQDGAGGRAAILTGKVYLTVGTELTFAVGGQADNARPQEGGSGGGGGTFVIISDGGVLDGSPLAVAGGGGGAQAQGSGAGRPASIDSNGYGFGGGGMGGLTGNAQNGGRGGSARSFGNGGGGASFGMDGTNGKGGESGGGGSSYPTLYGGGAGTFAATPGAYGGAGGGGNTAGGGGGGYYGGGGGSGYGAGGGGGSWFIRSFNGYDTVVTRSIATTLGPGSITITELSY